MLAITSTFTYCYSLRVSAILDHFGYSPPQLDQWQQCTWYDLGVAQDVLHQMDNCLLRGLPAAASPRAEPPFSFYMPTCPTPGGRFVKALQGRGSTQSATAVGPSSSTMVTPPKTEAKKKKKRKTPKCTVTSETITCRRKGRRWFQSLPTQMQRVLSEIQTTQRVLQRILLMPNDELSCNTVAFPWSLALGKYSL